MASIHRESNDGTIEDTPIENIAEAECPMLQPFESADEHTASNHTVHWLFISHTLSTFNSRTFEFGAVLYLASIFPGTLLPVSVYVIFRNCCAIISAAAVGRWIDGGERLKVVRTSIGMHVPIGFIQNLTNGKFDSWRSTRGSHIVCYILGP